MELIAEKREKLGKDTKSLRTEGILPGVIFGKDFESLPISTDLIGFKKVFAKAGETNLIDIKIASKSYKVLVKQVDYDPVTSRFLHVGFYKPNLTEKLEAQVPVEIIGEENNQLVKSNEAMVLTLMNELTVKCLPTDIPNAFIIDVSNWNEIDKGITIAELDYDRTKVEIDSEPEEMVAKLDRVEISDEPETDVSEEEALANIEATEEKDKEEDTENPAEDKTATPESQ